MSVKIFLMWNSKMLIYGGGDAAVAASLLKASNIIVLKVMPGMLLVLVLHFDYQKRREPVSLLDLLTSKGQKYIWYALTGYAIGLASAIATAALTNSPQPALIYLACAFDTRTCSPCVLDEERASRIVGRMGVQAKEPEHKIQWICGSTSSC